MVPPKYIYILVFVFCVGQFHQLVGGDIFSFVVYFLFLLDVSHKLLVCTGSIRIVPDFGGQYLDTAPIFPDIGIFAVPLSTYVMLETHITWVPCTSSDKNAMRRIGNILKYIIV